MSIARAALADTGMVAARESAALEPAYWSHLVGNFAWRARPAPITSYHFSAFSPFHTFPPGHEDGNHWGPSVALLKQSERTPYCFHFHSADMGHPLVIGTSGGRKPVLGTFLIAPPDKVNRPHSFL